MHSIKNKQKSILKIENMQYTEKHTTLALPLTNAKKVTVSVLYWT
jgi:hypothetical protein